MEWKASVLVPALSTLVVRRKGVTLFLRKLFRRCSSFCLSLEEKKGNFLPNKATGRQRVECGDQVKGALSI